MGLGPGHIHAVLLVAHTHPAEGPGLHVPRTAVGLWLRAHSQAGVLSLTCFPENRIHVPSLF